jgi:protoporphyrinogen oxidase
MSAKIVIVGAGPTGLGAAYRLQELGYSSWEIYERDSYVGGLAASFKDTHGFTWDIGGHVLFSHYEYVDKLVDKLLGDQYVLHQRDSWVWLLDSWVPYPFQNNVRHLPKDKLIECLMGLIRVYGAKDTSHNFREWMLATFGEGIAKYFMLPYNLKVWAYPPELMDKNWIAERVSIVDIGKILGNVVYERDEREWGPNSQFKFPLHGGTGGLFERFKPYVKGRLHLNEEMVELDTQTKVIRFSTGRQAGYDVLINTTPLDQLIDRMTPRPDFLVEAAHMLKHNGVFSVGIGIKQPCPSSKCWVYFPEDNCPFYRVTYFSNYSPYNVPDARQYYSLMCETSYSEHRPEDKGTIEEKTMQGLVNARLITDADRRDIETTHAIQAEYAYPIPSLERDKALSAIRPYLEKNGIYSRGRFGAWKYEVGNMDHSIMQGVDVVNMLLGTGDKCQVRI